MNTTNEETEAVEMMGVTITERTKDAIGADTSSRNYPLDDNELRLVYGEVARLVGDVDPDSYEPTSETVEMMGEEVTAEAVDAMGAGTKDPYDNGMTSD